MCTNAQFVEVLHHPEVFTDIPALESAGEVEWHKPPDHITRCGYGFTDNIKTKLIEPGNRNVVLGHDRHDFLPVIPFVKLDLPDCNFFVLIFDSAGMTLVGKGGCFFCGIGFL